MEETRNIKIDGGVYKISHWLIFICIDGEPFAHLDNFEFNVGDRLIMDMNNIKIREMPWDCPDDLKDYIKKNFKKVR